MLHAYFPISLGKSLTGVRSLSETNIRRLQHSFNYGCLFMSIKQSQTVAFTRCPSKSHFIINASIYFRYWPDERQISKCLLKCQSCCRQPIFLSCVDYFRFRKWSLLIFIRFVGWLGSIVNGMPINIFLQHVK